jgi:hypothetical protein
MSARPVRFPSCDAARSVYDSPLNINMIVVEGIQFP